MIELRNVSKYYGKAVVGLDTVNLHIEPGEFVSMVGQSGTGKTTLVKLLTAEERPSEGNVVVGGWDITRIKPREIPHLRRQIGVVFQDFRLLQKKTVFENIAFALEVSGASSHKIKHIVPQLLTLVSLEDKAHRFPYQLSGGQQQRVAVARALVHRPKLLLADEPTGNLDAINTQEIVELLKKINEFGTTVLLVTHNRDVVNRLKHRVVTIDGGRIISDRESAKYTL